jgi:hypothetical protein
MHKSISILLSLLLSFALLSPLKKEWRGEDGDSFPLSWYPMFSKPRPALERIVYMVGVLPDGTRRVIKSNSFVRGNMNQARMHVAKYAQRKKTSDELCKRAAERMSKRKRGPQSRMGQVRLVRGHFSREAFFRDGQVHPEKDVIMAACHIPRRKKLDLPRRGRVIQYDHETGTER